MRDDEKNIFFMPIFGALENGTLHQTYQIFLSVKNHNSVGCCFPTHLKLAKNQTLSKQKISDG